MLRLGLLVALCAPARALTVGTALASYSAALAANPLSVKVGTAAVLAIAGDAIAQGREDGPYDVKRASSFVAFDAAYRGGFQHAAFPWIIDHFDGHSLADAATAFSVPPELLDANVLAAIERTAINQLAIVPVIYYPLFFALTGIIQGLSTEQTLDRARDKFAPLMSRNLKFWVPAQYAQFAFFPLEWQVPYTCAMGLIWNVILSASAGDASSSSDEEKAPAVAAPSPATAGLFGVVVPSFLSGARSRSNAKEEAKRR